jgi:hypothetical protein
MRIRSLFCLCLACLALFCGCAQAIPEQEAETPVLSLSDYTPYLLGGYTTLDNVGIPDERDYIPTAAVPIECDIPWMAHQLYHVDEAATAHLSITFQDTTYAGDYLESYRFPYSEAIAHVYANEAGVRFAIDSTTNATVGIHIPDAAPDYSIPLSEESARTIMLAVLPDQIDLTPYQSIVTGAPGEGYLFEYAKQYRGIPTTERIFIRVENSGALSQYGTVLSGAFPTDDTPVDTSALAADAQARMLACFDEPHAVLSLDERWILHEGQPVLCYQAALIPYEINSTGNSNLKHLSIVYLPR